MKSPLLSGLSSGFDYSRMEILPWAERKIYLPRSVSPTQYGPYRSQNAPWQIEPLQEIANDENESVVLVKANGVGGSTIGTVSLGYFIDQDPGAAIWVSATEKLIRDYSKDTLFPILQNITGISAEDLSDRTKASMFEVRLPAMTLLLAWGGSEASAEQKHIRFLYLDEFEIYPDMVGKFEARTTRQFNSRKVYITKPRFEGGISHKKYMLTDQREWHWPCLKCDHPLPLKFKGHVFYDKFYHADNQPDWGKIFPTIRYVCPHCQYEHFETEQLHNHIVGDRAKYIPLHPRANDGLRRKQVGFRWNAMLLHLIDGVPAWQKLVQEFMMAEQMFTYHGAILDLQDFIFKRMGEWWKTGQEHDRKDIKKLPFSINDPLTNEWDEICLTVDTQETHYWFTAWGWKRYPNEPSRARLLGCGKLLDEGSILKKQEEYGLRGPQFVFVDGAWSPGRRVHKMCATHNWTVLVGTDRDGFDHITNRKDHRGNAVIVRKIYSREKRIDVGIGTRDSGRLYCAQYDFASNIAEGMLQERLDNSDRLRFEIPEDAPDEFMQHLAGMQYTTRTNKKTGMKEWFWKEVAPPHMRDCAKMAIVFAAMDKFITVEPTADSPKGAAHD